MHCPFGALLPPESTLPLGAPNRPATSIELRMILLDNMSFAYPPGNHQLFRNLSLTIKPSSWVALTGPDGGGKTSLGKLIKGLLQPDSGTVTFQGFRENDVRRSVGYLGGDPYDSMVGLSVVEDIAFGLENQALPRSEMKTRIDNALVWVGLCGMERRLVHTLSGGEQQKVALAGVLASGAETLILDDALSMTDRPTRTGLRLLIEQLRSQLKLTIIESTDHVEDILTTDRVLFLSHGSILFDGDPQSFAASRLGGDWVSIRAGLSALRVEFEKRGVRWESVEWMLKYRKKC